MISSEIAGLTWRNRNDLLALHDPPPPSLSCVLHADEESEMKFEIKNRWDGSIIYQDEAESFRALVFAAVKSRADLSRANLYGADLSRANLSGADLSGADNIICVHWHGFSFYIQKEKTKIGCEYRTNDEWLDMSIDMAVSLGIKAENFDRYRKTLKLGISLLP